MNSKLKEITEKIYLEGVDKADKKAAEIIKNAEDKADKTLKEAEKEAEKIIDSAKKEAADLQKNVKSEIKLSARQSINSLKQSITNLITTEVSKEETKKALEDNDFVKQIIEKIIEGFVKNQSDGIDLNIILSDSEKEEFEKYFSAKQKDLLDKGLEIKFSDKIQAGFEITPKDNSYKLSFTDETFEIFFKNYLKTRSVKLLYE